jgi:hypothetical protein
VDNVVYSNFTQSPNFLCRTVHTFAHPLFVIYFACGSWALVHLFACIFLRLPISCGLHWLPRSENSPCHRRPDLQTHRLRLLLPSLPGQDGLWRAVVFLYSLVVADQARNVCRESRCRTMKVCVINKRDIMGATSAQQEKKCFRSHVKLPGHSTKVPSTGA